MDKELLHKKILAELNTLLQSAIDAAMQAYNTATHEENIADNKYDTLGLEASYLAQGQAKRVAECEADIKAFTALEITDYTQGIPISIGALVYLMNDMEEERALFLTPVSGGLSIVFLDKNITLITASAPLGKSLIGRTIDDEIEFNIAGQIHNYQITAIY